MHDIRYRSDIDGLRTVAVIPVVLFHLGLAGFSGGFVGVDVFFVISGYLITGLIAREIDEGGFTIVGFYERRARRILPAFVAMVLFCGVAGWFLFVPEDFKQLGAAMAAASLFSSNFLFWQNTGYFADAVELQPLVHSWSLAVEEQYYIVFPMFVLILGRFGRSYIWPTLALTLISFATSVAMTYLAPGGGYYLPQSRAWELLLGSLLAFGAVPTLRRAPVIEAVAAIGLALVLGGVFLLDANSRFPGVNALWPTIGAAMTLHAGASGRRTWAARLLGSKPFVGIGLISYSLYLWHWPLIVFARYQRMGELGPLDMVAIVAATFVLAYLSWRFVERPFRNRQRVSRTAVFAASAVSIALATLGGVAIYATGGAAGRFAGLHMPPAVRADMPRPGEPNCFIEVGTRRTETWEGDACVLGLGRPGGRGKAILFWGDSHAYQYRDVIAAIARRRGKTVVLYTAAGCSPIFDTTIPSHPLCAPSHDAIPQVIRKYDVGRVILAAEWQEKMRINHIPMSKIAVTVARLRAMGLSVKLLGDNPRFGFYDVNTIGYRLQAMEK